MPKLFSIGEVQKVLANLLRERVSIRDIGSILEILGDYGTLTRDPDILTEYVRQKLRRTITKEFVPDGRARVITLNPDLERTISEGIKQSDQGMHVVLEPTRIQELLSNIKQATDHFVNLGMTPMVITSPVIRRHVKDISEQVYSDLVVLSYNELEQDVEIISDWMVS